jgi:hypothetical protein
VYIVYYTVYVSRFNTSVLTKYEITIGERRMINLIPNKPNNMYVHKVKQLKKVQDRSVQQRAFNDLLL